MGVLTHMGHVETWRFGWMILVLVVICTLGGLLAGAIFAFPIVLIGELLGIINADSGYRVLLWIVVPTALVYGPYWTAKAVVSLVVNEINDAERKRR